MGLVLKGDNITPKQLQAVQLLSNGDNIVSVAAQLEISRKVIYDWLSDKEFKKCLDDAIEKKTSILFVQGLSQLEEILLYSPSNKEKLQAFEIIAKLGDRYKDKTEITVKQETKKVNIDTLLDELKDF